MRRLTRRLFVVGRDARERLLAAQLPRQLAPECSDDRAIRLGDRVPRGDLVSDQHDSVRRRKLRCPRLCKTRSIPSSSPEAVAEKR